ncbi:hypothetical protein [Streptomyces niger]|uniref:hypothetical protein n=1 Tax=Streptomyces niger TaxID=66373 RepID=UPI000AFA46AA|nr:hypothetical protein [Streptomyces niger]
MHETPRTAQQSARDVPEELSRALRTIESADRAFLVSTGRPELETLVWLLRRDLKELVAAYGSAVVGRDAP